MITETKKYNLSQFAFDTKKELDDFVKNNPDATANLNGADLRDAEIITEEGEPKNKLTIK